MNFITEILQLRRNPEEKVEQSLKSQNGIASN